MNNDLIFYQILSTNFLRKCIEISLKNFYVDIGNYRGREVRYFVIWARPLAKFGQQVIIQCSVNMSVKYQSTCQPAVSQLNYVSLYSDQ